MNDREPFDPALGRFDAFPCTEGKGNARAEDVRFPNVLKNNEMGWLAGPVGRSRCPLGRTFGDVRLRPDSAV